MTGPALPPRMIVSGFMAGLLLKLDWRKRPQTPIAPSNHALRLIALLRRGGYVIVPREPTAKMAHAARFWHGDTWSTMINAWENEADGPETFGNSGDSQRDDDRMPPL